MFGIKCIHEVVDHFEQTVQDIPGILQLLVTESGSVSGVAPSRLQGLCGPGQPFSYSCPSIVYKHISLLLNRAGALHRD